MILQRGDILTVDVVQVGSTTAGSTAHLQIVGLVLPIAPTERLKSNVPKTNIRPRMHQYRQASKPGSFATFQADVGTAVVNINDILDQVRLNSDELFNRILALEKAPSIARYNANIVTPVPLAIATDIVPWAQITIQEGESWLPIEAWATAKTAPVGDDLIFDVQTANSFSAVDTPEWVSIFPTGDANKLLLPDGSNQLPAPITKFGA